MKIGNKIACISSPDDILKIDTIYTILSFHRESFLNYICLSELPEYAYPENRFISLIEYRKRKMKKLNGIK